mmetsp:Transcript_35852/g.101480  ORF Transcript_35852/g.101480 Transcript_35852/m.101480 type:complete len:106 (+) Transcript_35852:2310-2627(+)
MLGVPGLALAMFASPVNVSALACLWQTLATAAGEMDGNGLFYFSRGGSATARRSSLSDQHLDGKPLRTPRQEMRRKMTESVALQHQAKSPVPHSVDRLLQAVQFD